MALVTRKFPLPTTPKIWSTPALASAFPTASDTLIELSNHIVVSVWVLFRRSMRQIGYNDRGMSRAQSQMHDHPGLDRLDHRRA
jgi:hypothetical protein